jgi:hypothetical protein
MSPLTRIIGGRLDDRCKSEALFLTAKASNSEISTRASFSVQVGFGFIDPKRNRLKPPGLAAWRYTLKAALRFGSITI